MRDKVRYGFDVSAAIPKDIQPADLIVNGVEYWPVVRCKDCKYYRLRDKGDVCTRPDGGLWHISTDTYCSYGVRKEI